MRKNEAGAVLKLRTNIVNTEQLKEQGRVLVEVPANGTTDFDIKVVHGGAMPNAGAKILR